MSARLARPLAAAFGCALAFSLLFVAVHDVGWVIRWDATALGGLRSLSIDHRTIWHVGDAVVVTMNTPGFLLALTALCATGIYLRRHRQLAAGLVVVVTANLISQFVKALAAHPRFHGVLGDGQITNPAFPSGHATAAMSFALAAVLIAPSRWRRPTAIVGGLYALAVSIALTIQGWHYPSDVIGGLLVATGVSMLVVAGLRGLDLRHSEATETPRRRLALPVLDRRALELLAAAGVAAIAAVVLTHPNEVTNFAATHTSAVAAALGIAASLVVLVSSVTAELEAG